MTIVTIPHSYPRYPCNFDHGIWHVKPYTQPRRRTRSQCFSGFYLSINKNLIDRSLFPSYDPKSHREFSDWVMIRFIVVKLFVCGCQGIGSLCTPAFNVDLHIVQVKPAIFCLVIAISGPRLRRVNRWHGQCVARRRRWSCGIHPGCHKHHLGMVGIPPIWFTFFVYHISAKWCEIMLNQHEPEPDRQKYGEMICRSGSAPIWLQGAMELMAPVFACICHIFQGSNLPL